jgi:hypothetical protein
MMRYPQVTSRRSDYLRLLLRVASPMPLLDFSFFVGNFLTVTTKVCLLYGIFNYTKHNSVSSVGSVED